MLHIMIVPEMWTPLCGRMAALETVNTKKSKKGKNCKVCESINISYLKVRDLLTNNSNRSLALKHKVSERFLRRIRSILNCANYGVCLNESNEIFVRLNKDRVTHIEVSKSGIFRHVDSHRQYSVNLNNRNIPYLHTRYKNYSAALLVYNTFAETPLNRNQTVGFKDGNCLNLHFDNLYPKKIKRSPEKILKNLKHNAAIWLETIDENDDRLTLAKKLGKSKTYVYNRLNAMKKLLDLPRKKKSKLRDVLLMFLNKDGENGKTGGENQRNQMFSSDSGTGASESV